MRRISFLATFSFLLRTSVSEPAPRPLPLPDVQDQYLHFSPPSYQARPIFLLKRQSCPADHTSCANLNAPDACCPSGSNCARDQAGNIACCLDNYVCTGVIGSSAPASTTSSFTSGSGSLTGVVVGTITVTSTAGVTGSSDTTTAVTATTPGSITGGAAGGGSTVPNAYYPFTYMPTSFANAAVCSSYYTSCQVQSASCFNSLAGINGVTINGLGGGTTQAGSTGIIQQSASAICSSLSQSACYGLQSTQCASVSTGGLIQQGRGPRQTACPGMVYVAAAGAAAAAAAGAMGVVL